MSSSYRLTLLSEQASSGPYYVVTYTTASTYGPVLAGSPAYLPDVGSSAIVTIGENSPTYLSFKLTNGTGNPCEICTNSQIYTFTGSAPIPPTSSICCTPTNLNVTASITPGYLQVTYTAGTGSNCATCSLVNIESSSNGTTWGFAGTSSCSGTSSFLTPINTSCTSSLTYYFRAYQECGALTSSYSVTASYNIPATSQSCCTPSITAISASNPETSSIDIYYTQGSGSCCVSCSYITLYSSSNGTNFGGAITGSCTGSYFTVAAPPSLTTYWYQVQQTCSGSISSSLSLSSSFYNSSGSAPVTCSNQIIVNNDGVGGIGITSVKINTYDVTYVSGDNFTVDIGEEGTFTTNITGSNLTVEICYTSNTNDNHINLSDCAFPQNSFCCDNLDSGGGCCTFEGVTINCEDCTININVLDGACE